MRDIEAETGGDRGATVDTQAKPSDAAADTHAERKELAARERRASQDAAREQAREVGADDTKVAAPSIGGGGRPRRLLLVCLDGATPELAIGAWRTQLRTMHMLTDRGTRGQIQSSIPWSSTPAWLSLLSGLEPGRLGVYGRQRRPNRSYAPPSAPDARDIAEPRLWDMLAPGRRVGVIGAPATTSPPSVHGHMVAELPSGEIVTSPPALAQQIAAWLADGPPEQQASDDLDRAIGRIYARSERRFRLARRLLARDTYDCFVLYDDGIAEVQRLLWHALDVTHPRYQPNHPFADAISAFYRFVDDQIGELLELIDADTIVAVVSACGAQALDGELALNEWLIEQGDLVLASAPAGPTPLERCEVDWERTRAWADEDGAIYLNVAGREPQGCVPPGEIERVIANLRARLEALTPPSGRAGEAPALIAYRPVALYGTAHGVAPDVLVVCARAGWRLCADVGVGRVWLSTLEQQLDAATGSPAGFFAIYDPHAPAEGRVVAEATIYDLAPTLLTLLGEPIAPRLRGRVLPGFEP